MLCSLSHPSTPELSGLAEVYFLTLLDVRKSAGLPPEAEGKSVPGLVSDGRWHSLAFLGL